jgi:ABC-type lipoprotein export system ATPase subunit
VRDCDIALPNFTAASCWLGAFINQPRLLLADEPTGNLDSQTGTEIMNFIREFNESLAMTIIMITRERALAECYARRMIFRGDGKSFGDQSHVASATAGQTRGGTI